MIPMFGKNRKRTVRLCAQQIDRNPGKGRWFLGEMGIYTKSARNYVSRRLSSQPAGVNLCAGRH